VPSLVEVETEKYEKTWSIPDYHRYSHGEHYSEMFMEITGAKPGESVIDLGCGTGRGGQALEEQGLIPTYLDLKNYNNLEPFIDQPLWEPIEGHWDYGLCCDVMEHLPPEYTMLAIKNMLDACEGLFLSVCFQDEAFGALVGEPLHLTVMPFVWWRDNLREMGNLIEARDLSPPSKERQLKVGVFYVT
jgi:SAM-dependent methyltransferase